MKDSGMEPSEGSKAVPKAATIESFFGKEYDGMGRILFCKEDAHEKYHELFKTGGGAERKCYHNIDDLTKLRSI